MHLVAVSVSKCKCAGENTDTWDLLTLCLWVSTQWQKIPCESLHFKTLSANATITNMHVAYQQADDFVLSSFKNKWIFTIDRSMHFAINLVITYLILNFKGFLESINYLENKIILIMSTLNFIISSFYYNINILILNSFHF